MFFILAQDYVLNEIGFLMKNLNAKSDIILGVSFIIVVFIRKTDDRRTGIDYLAVSNTQWFQFVIASTLLVIASIFTGKNHYMQIIK